MLVRLKKVMISVVALSMLSVGTPALAYDKAKFDESGNLITDAYNIPVPEDIDDSYVLVKTRGVAEGEYERLTPDFERTGEMIKTDGVFVIQGAGTVIKPGYVITAAHVVVPSEVWVGVGQERVVPLQNIKIYMRFVMLLDKRDDPVAVGWVHAVDLEHDIAIVRYVPTPDSPLKPIPFEWGTKADTERGDAIAFIQHLRVPIEGCDQPLVLDISGGEFVEQDGYIATVIGYDVWKKDSFGAYLPGIPGDSGSLVYAFKDGKPIVVGVLYGGGMGLTIMAHIDIVAEMIGE